jgi:trehalose-phosphatase
LSLSGGIHLPQEVVLPKSSRHLTRARYPEIIKRVKRLGPGSGLSLFLDFDGTLTPVAGHPSDAHLLKRVRKTLVALNERYPLAIISGRGLADLKEKIAIDGLVYIGNHGMEVSAPDFSFVYDIGAKETLAMNRVAGALGKLASDYDGTVLERKGLTLSIHFRLLHPGVKNAFLKELSKLLKPTVKGGLIKITGGKGLVEVRPTADWDKGSALAWIMERRGFKGTVPLCIGDDETDEDAFRVIEGKGISLFVGKRASSADFFLTEQADVEPFLVFLAETL